MRPEELIQRPLPKTESELISRKFDFQSVISKCQADLKFNEQMLDFQDQKIASIEASLQEERAKRQNFENLAFEGSIENQVEKKKAEYGELDNLIENLRLELNRYIGKRASVK